MSTVSGVLRGCFKPTRGGVFRPKAKFTRGQAITEANRLSGGLRPYECGNCGAWHIGHAA